MRAQRLLPILCFLALSALVMSCQFDVSGVNSGNEIDASPNAPDASPNAPDAAPNAPDAAPNAPDAAPDAAPIPFCGWGYDPVYFDACTDPPGPLGPLVLDIPGTYTYDTDNPATLTDPNGVTVTHTNSVVSGNRIIWASSVIIRDMVVLRVVGARPFLIASESTIDVTGDINVSSFWDGNPTYDVGADSEPAECNALVTAGETCTEGGGGGGGGGFGGVGGTGGSGGNGRGCASGADSVGGMGGAMVGTPNNLRAGCAGGDGGDGDGTNEFGIGAPGGGAVHLTAATTLTIAGKVLANGAGGRGSINNRAAGGGGGSGGMIGLEAQSLMLQGSAILAANGGGGGGGGNNNPGMPGQDAPEDGTQATGGAGEATKGGDGGTGGWVSDVNGQTPGPAPDRGGGGGGGGVGYILIHGVTPSGTGTRVSPTPTMIP